MSLLAWVSDGTKMPWLQDGLTIRKKNPWPLNTTIINGRTVCDPVHNSKFVYTCLLLGLRLFTQSGKLQLGACLLLNIWGLSFDICSALLEYLITSSMLNVKNVMMNLVYLIIKDDMD